MKITEPKHKGILLSGFSKRDLKNPEKPPEQVVYTLDKLEAAGKAFKKLIDSIDKESANGIIMDNEIEFTPSEIAILKGNFDRQAKDGFVAADCLAASELLDIFNGVKKESIEKVKKAEEPSS